MSAGSEFHTVGAATRKLREYRSCIVYYYVHAPNKRGHKAMMLSDVVPLSVAYIVPKSRTERPRKTRIPLSRSKVKVTRPLYSPPCWRARQLQRWAWERVGCGKPLLRCRLLGGARRFGAHGEKRGGVSVGTYWAWETTATMRCARRR